MTSVVQNLIVLAVIVAAAAYLGWCVWRIAVKRASGCGSCDAKRAADDPAAPKTKPFVPIDSLSGKNTDKTD